jgi:hypothetical protein
MEICLNSNNFVEVKLPFDYDAFITLQNRRFKKSRNLKHLLHINAFDKLDRTVEARYMKLFHPARQWAKNNNIPNTVFIDNSTGEFHFIFDNPTHAILFKLKWV